MATTKENYFKSITPTAHENIPTFYVTLICGFEKIRKKHSDDYAIDCTVEIATSKLLYIPDSQPQVKQLLASVDKYLQIRQSLDEALSTEPTQQEGNDSLKQWFTKSVRHATASMPFEQASVYLHMFFAQLMISLNVLHNTFCKIADNHKLSYEQGPLVSEQEEEEFTNLVMQLDSNDEAMSKTNALILDKVVLYTERLTNLQATLLINYDPLLPRSLTSELATLPSASWLFTDEHDSYLRKITAINLFSTSYTELAELYDPDAPIEFHAALANHLVDLMMIQVNHCVHKQSYETTAAQMHQQLLKTIVCILETVKEHERLASLDTILAPVSMTLCTEMIHSIFIASNFADIADGSEEK